VKKIGWLSLAVSSPICILILFFPVSLAYLIYSSVRPTGFFACSASEGRLLLVLAGICYALAVLPVVLILVGRWGRGLEASVMRWARARLTALACCMGSDTQTEHACCWEDYCTWEPTE
jgi:hypothetical protein